jgi:ribosome biogenesis GTPase
MSGVGKSTLVNLLLGSDVQRVLGLRGDDRGQHATTHRELFVLDDGALLIDTPGVRSPALADAEGIDEAFADIAELAQSCRFGDCRHESEPGCAVRGAVTDERLDSMRKLEREGSTAEQRRARSRVAGRIGREAMRTKGRPD